MNEYYQNKDTGIMYRVWEKSKGEFIVFKQVLKQYFDGLLELENIEEEIGKGKNIDECLSLMV